MAEAPNVVGVSPKGRIQEFERIVVTIDGEEIAMRRKTCENRGGTLAKCRDAAVVHDDRVAA